MVAYSLTIKLVKIICGHPVQKANIQKYFLFTYCLKSETNQIGKLIQSVNIILIRTKCSLSYFYENSFKTKPLQKDPSICFMIPVTFYYVFSSLEC